MKSFLFLLSVAALTAVVSVRAGEVRGTNQTLEEGFGVRYDALSNTCLGIRGDETSAGCFSASLNDARQLWVTIAHSEKFTSAMYDNITFAIPYDTSGTLAFGLARFAVGDNALFRVEPINVGSEPYAVITTADYVLTGAMARKFGRLDVGANISLLYRTLDQHGAGIRGDISGRYTFWERLFLSALFKGAIPSSAVWESDYAEYDPPDLFAGAGCEIPSSYFYGIFRMGLQTKGLFQEQAKSIYGERGSRVTENSLDVLRTVGFGLEYELDLGLAFRAGIPEADISSAGFQPTLGLGYRYRNFIRLDYAYVPHPAALSAHKISVSLSPALVGKNISRPSSRSTVPALPGRSIEQPAPAAGEQPVLLPSERESLPPGPESGNEDPEELPDEPEEILEE